MREARPPPTPVKTAKFMGALTPNASVIATPNDSKEVHLTARWRVCVPADEEKKTEEDFSASGDDPQRRDHLRRQIPIEPVRYSKNREKFPSRHSVAQTLPQTASIGYGRQETNADPNS